jgi:signal transduction histidine kinase
VLLNLLGNAIKYNRPGGQVRVWAAAEGAMACLTVADTGVGIDAAELPQIFEPFYRGDAARAQVGGSGIGLAVTRSLVHAMGGRIEVDSTAGRGSSFRVWLPAAS